MIILQIINNTYVVIFKDGSKKEQSVEVAKEVFNQFDQFELEDIREMHEKERHVEQSQLYEETLYKRAVRKSLDVSDVVENNILSNQLRAAINSRSETQKGRIIKYYFEGKNEYEIAKEENTTQQAINKNLHQAIEKIKRNFKKLGLLFWL